MQTLKRPYTRNRVMKIPGCDHGVGGVRGGWRKSATGSALRSDRIWTASPKEEMSRAIRRLDASRRVHSTSTLDDDQTNLVLCPEELTVLTNFMIILIHICFILFLNIGYSCDYGASGRRTESRLERRKTGTPSTACHR